VQYRCVQYIECLNLVWSDLVPAASPDAEAWTEAGAAGIMLSGAPEEYGGGTFAHEAIVTEELAQAGIHFGSCIQSIVANYILAYGNNEQKRN
jgi:acyl-CoA dehydrogenase